MELERGVPEITGAKGSPGHILYLFRRVDTRIVFRTHYLGLFAPSQIKRRTCIRLKIKSEEKKTKLIHFNMKNFNDLNVELY